MQGPPAGSLFESLPASYCQAVPVLCQYNGPREGRIPRRLPFSTYPPGLFLLAVPGLLPGCSGHACARAVHRTPPLYITRNFTSDPVRGHPACAVVRARDV